MRIAIYHPSLNLFGGGETVALTIAESLSKENEVDIFTYNPVDKHKLEKFFCLDLSDVNIVRFGRHLSKMPLLHTIRPSMLLKQAYGYLNDYDVVIDTCTNGWFDKKLKPKTLCYIHYPFFFRKKKGIKKPLNRFMIHPENAFKYDTIICNSQFTKESVKKLTDKEIHVIYPPVNVESINPDMKKENRIVTIGRFTYEKKHEVMIEAFKGLHNSVKDYTFDLIGSFQEDAGLYHLAYLNKLKEIARGFPINFHLNMPNEKVLRFLERSKIYWHARGYGETDPVEYENFGITTVEAMAAGCVPIVINLGAQPEIVEHKKTGFCWDTPKELIKYTLEEIRSQKIRKERVLSDAKSYGKERFNKAILRFILNE